MTAVLAAAPTMTPGVIPDPVGDWALDSATALDGGQALDGSSDVTFAGSMIPATTTGPTMTGV